jgi:uncharacterized protein YqeY
MPLLERLQKDMVEAMKSKQELRLSALRMLKAALMKHKVDTMKELDEIEDIKVLNQIIKQRKESADQFRRGGRLEQALKEEQEQRILEAYLPAAATEEEIEAAIGAALAESGVTSLKQMGAVMKSAQAKLAGKSVDGKALSDKVRARLS